MIKTLNILLENIKPKFNSATNKKIASHAKWSLLGAVISKGVVLISTMIVARILGKELFGQLGIINSTVLMFVAFSGFGMGATSSKFIAENRDKDTGKVIDVYLISNLFSGIIGLILASCIVYFAPYIAERSLNAPHLTGELRVASIIFFFSILNGAQNGTLAGFENFRAIAFSNILKAISQVIFTIYGALTLGVYGAILGFSISYIISWGVNFYYVRHHISRLNQNIWIRFQSLNIEKLSILWKFSLPAAISSMIMPPVIWWAKTMVVKNNGFESIANFEVAEQWRAQILFIPGVLSQIILPVISNQKARKDRKDFFSTIKTNFFLNISISICIVILIIIFGETILSGYGEEYSNTFPLYILAASAILISASNVITPIVMTYNKIWLGVLINIIWVICLLYLNRFFAKYDYAENGLALAIFISYFISLGLQVVLVKYLINQNK